VRPVGQAAARLKEAGKLGFTAALAPPRRGKAKDRTTEPGIGVREIGHLRQLVALFGDGPRRAARSLGAAGARS